MVSDIFFPWLWVVILVFSDVVSLYLYTSPKEGQQLDYIIQNVCEMGRPVRMLEEVQAPVTRRIKGGFTQEASGG